MFAQMGSALAHYGKGMPVGGVNGHTGSCHL